jgi:hypothetical protein
MRAWKTTIVLFVLALIFPGTARMDVPKFFSISSNRTYAPGEKPGIEYWGQGVGSLQFRVYRVNDPVRFFKSLRDEHNFGGQAQRLPQQLTFLEEFHRWKTGSHSAIRNLFRHQYPVESRSRIHDFFHPPQPKQGATKQATTEFAAVPLLNPLQVVLVWTQAVGLGERWQSQTIPVDVTKKGLYLVEATNGSLQAYTIVSVTELGLIVKGSPGRADVRAVDRATGAPVADAGVVAWATDQVHAEDETPVARELGRKQTNADGTAAFEITTKPESVLLMARRGDDFAVTSLYGRGLFFDDENSLMGYVYTDRPVYRPGHTVHFRAILRSQGPSGYQIPAVEEVQVSAQDPDGKPVFQRTLPVSAMGTLNADIELPVSSALGYYNIEVHAGKGEASGGFQVEEYKKPEYDVKVTPVKKRLLQGESISAVIEAKYFYGEPVANAQVKYVVHRSRYWLPWYLEDEDNEDAGQNQADEEDTYSPKEEQEEKSGKLDAQGHLTIQVATGKAKIDQIYRIEARVTDAGNREISGAGYAVATVGPYYIRIEPAQYLFKPGEQAQFNIETRDYDNNPVPRTAFNVDLIEHHWQKKQDEEKTVASASGVTDDSGKGRVHFKVNGGSYVARARSKTANGREVEGTAYVWVSGGASWYGEQEQRVDIVPDRKTYKPGETAHVMIMTGVPESYVWVTAESQGVNDSRMVHATSASFTVDIPIRSEYAPNFFVNACFLRDQKFFQGSKSIKVPPVERQLTVDLKASKPQFRPGDKGSFTLDAKDSTGRPVVGEFSLGVVDEAIYSIRKDMMQDILGFFYGNRWLRVQTDNSLSYQFMGFAGQRRMQLAQLQARKALSVIKPDKLIEPKIRKAFPDTMFWTADLRTNSQGHAEATMEFPDALTTWRATARGITADSKVGSAIERTVVRKNLILRLVTPRFFREGDEVTISVLADNYLTSQKSVKVSLDMKGVELMDGATRSIDVPSKGEGRVDFRVRARTAGSAVLLGKALTDEESDAMELTLPVIPYGVRMTIPRSGSLSDAKTEAQEELAFPADAAAASRKLVVGVTPSVAGAVFGALDYLSTFPYGCTEQTMSSFLPNIIVAQAVKQLGLKSKIDPVDLDKKIRAGFDRLYDYQHEDGGWGWWKTDDSAEFMTTYVMLGLKQAQAAGYQLKPQVLPRAEKWLGGRWPQIKDTRADLRAYIAYATGTHLDDVWQARAKMTPYGLAMLGLAMQDAKDARAAEIATTLEKSAETNDAEAWWKESLDPFMEFEIDASAESTAYALKFLTHQLPQSPLLAKAALYLVNHRNEGYYWSSTKQTAMVVYGLTDYLAQSGELHPDSKVTVWVNDRQVLERKFGESDAFGLSPFEIEIPSSQLGPTNKVRILKSGSGRVYWSASAIYYTAAAKATKTGTVSLNLLRDYFRLTPTQSGDKVVHKLEPLTGTLARGDVIAVRLTVSGSDWKYLLIEDPIPAGAEFIERDDLYEIAEKPPWWTNWSTRREFHDDRAALFQTYFRNGQQQYFYLLKVVNPGVFKIGPARVEPMYQPGFLSTTEAKTWEVK